MNSLTERKLNVTGMSCQKCVSKIRTSIQDKDQNAIVSGVPNENILTVTSFLTTKVIEAIVIDAGYKPASAPIDDERTQKKDSNTVKATNPTNEQSNIKTEEHQYKLSITGMTCASCVSTVQKALRSSSQVVSAEVNFANRTAHVVTEGSFETLIEAVASAGYEASLILDEEKSEANREKKDLEEYRNKIQSSVLGLGLGVPLMLYGLLGGDMMVSSITDRFVWLFVGLVTFAIMVRAGKHYFVGAWKAFKSHQANMDMLIALGTGSAWFYSMLVLLTPTLLPESAHHLYFEASVMIIGLINLGQALELRARRKTSQALHRLLDLRPKMATLVKGNSESRISVSDIQVNDILRVRSGDKIPVDGEILEGSSTVNESMLTGEAKPVKKTQGDVLSAGTVNGQGSLLFKATRIGSDTLLAQIITMVSKAQNSKPPISVLADKVSSVFVPSVIIISILTALVWFNLGSEFVYSYMLVTSISVLIIACPCALGLATPISTMIGIGKAAEYGGLIRNGEALQRASELTVILLDKTGTITEGKPKVVKQILTKSILDEQDHPNNKNKFLAQIVHSLESRANHPLADALLEHSKVFLESNETLPLDEFESLVGLGVRGSYQGSNYYLGNERLMKEKGVSIEMDGTEGLEYANATRVYLAEEKNSNEADLIGVFYIEDPIKKDIKAAISSFKEQGMRVVMLTGDNPQTAKSVANDVGIDDYHAQLMPEDKLNWVKQLQNQGEVVGMIGDGINDAPALAQADVGFAMGAGTDVAMESADITLIHNDLKGVADVIQISKATLNNIKQNLWGAFAYNGLGIPIAAGILFPFTGWLLSPIVAGAAMSLSSITVVMNANRLRLFRISVPKNTIDEEEV
ncbi:copper-exporting ATPase [Marinomonas ushuaiensis DSM 15871]|uniref:Copper-exporting P-type ATPase n=1 Tax=Marinomonas ushuaiensis DSM 15871 TaxID=1122207 RepID=X7E698_9GAMM|nr:heavy metal translocating P-type ATPase [Marinomonas ushuaiensis]ETX11457.1 copper-exporting ATPase [Marinomonas ushuaiensis DSM 15871]